MMELTLALLWLLPSYSLQTFFESLGSLGLLGSHFGLPQNAAFDYVVIGGGTAGLTIAHRLAEDGSSSVAVVEAGSFYELDNGNRSSIPAFGPYGSGNKPSPSLINPRIDWQQYSIPQPFNNQPLFYPAGRTLGGGSARNYQAYHRGTIDAYEQWAQQVADNSYSFDNFLPFFKRSIHFTPPSDASSIHFNASAFSNGSGPLQLSFGPYVNPMTPFMSQALDQAGLSMSQDFNSGILNGYGAVPVTQDPVTQERSSSETSFLREAMQTTSNLMVFTNTLAKQVLFNGVKEATAVRVENAGAEFSLSANKEVIISAGAFRSPQLLMVSGVGPRDILQKFRIPVVRDAPGIGQNMWDQPLFGPSYKVNVITHSALADPGYAQQATTEYIANRTGMLTNGGGGVLGFEKLPPDLRANLKSSTKEDFDAAFPKDWPEIEYLMVDAWSGPQQDSILGAPRDGASYITISAGLLAPFSRGNVSLNSTDTAVNPIISPNWLEDPRDQEFAIQMYRRARQIGSTNAMLPVIVGPEAYPGPNVTTDEQLLDVIRNSFSTIHHAGATCAMGQSNDSMAVVDSHARVFGVGKLRVVDASAFPFMPPGHPQATVYALAEKIAANILAGS